MILKKKHILSLFFIVLPTFARVSTLQAEPATKRAKTENAAYKVYGTTKSVLEATKKDPGGFYEIEKKKYDKIYETAREEYLKKFWEELAKKEKTSVENAQKNYFKKRVNVKEAELKQLLTELKDHPQLSKLSSEERKNQVRQYLEGKEQQQILEAIIQQGIDNKKFVMLYPKPTEPTYEIQIGSHDVAKYGPKSTDTKPMGCKDDKCPITIVEYSEFQCPFCKKVLPDAAKILREYKGKIRWYTRDFLLDFHDRAHPAGMAAKCSQFQGKFWEMYHSIFDDQRNLSDEALIKRAEKLKLDMKKFKTCFQDKNSDSWKKANNIIQENQKAGHLKGVRGTPAFFINGKKLSGALPYSEFKRVIEEQLKKKTS